VNARTLIITAGAIVALAAPAVANARILPANKHTKHAVKKHAVKQVLKRQGQSRQIYVYYPAPTTFQSEKSLKELEDDYNADLIAHGLDPIDFSNPGSTSTAPESTPTEAAPASASAASASLAVASAPSTSDPVAGSTSADWDPCLNTSTI